MQDIEVKIFADLNKRIAEATAAFSDLANAPGKLTIDNEKIVRRAVRLMVECCSALELKSAVEILSTRIDKTPQTVEMWEFVQDVFRNAFEEQRVFRVDGTNIHYLVTEKPFGEAVSSRFQSCEDDIEWASRCLAFGLPTASVFHMMRAGEKAVQELGIELGVTNVDKEWGKILSDMDEKIQGMEKNSVERARWAEAKQNLWNVKEAWRNPTMHPRGRYTQEQGERVFEAMKILMQSLTTLV